MKNSDEYAQRIKKHYVAEDCMQVMFLCFKGFLTLLSDNGITYYKQPNNFGPYINNYFSDLRKEQFPFNDIAVHTQYYHGKKCEFVNQLMEFNKPYLLISNCLVEKYAIKDGDEAIIISKTLTANDYKVSYLSNEEVKKIYHQPNTLIFYYDGTINKDGFFPTEEEIVEYYKQLAEKTLEQVEEKIYFNGVATYRDKIIKESLEANIRNLAINSINKPNILLDENIVFVEYNEFGIQKVKTLTVTRLKPDLYKVETLEYPLIKYTLERAKNLEQTNRKVTKEPTFNKLLNPYINKVEVEKGKKMILQKTQKNNAKN